MTKKTVKSEESEKRLPGMEDAKIEELQNAAKRYAGIRDKRMALTLQEIDLNDLLLKLMKKHDRERYHYDGIEIKIVSEKEKVKVRIDKDEEA